jgi:hypothetical protein
MISPLAFNGPLEIGLRSLILLFEAFPEGLDLQRLVVLDYLLVHSGDIPNGPVSLHPPSPLRAGEVAIRRGLVEQWLHLYGYRGLITRQLDGDGIRYVAQEGAAALLDALSSDYVVALRERANWVLETFGSLNDEELEAVLTNSIGRWRSEFVVIEGEEDTL